MRFKRIIVLAAASAATVVNLIGFGSATAHASEPCQELYTNFGAQIEVCVTLVNTNDVKMHYSVVRPGSTDERIWFEVYAPGCGNSYGYTDFSGNDVTHTSDSFEMVCRNPIRGVISWPTESGQQSSTDGVGDGWGF
jgi:hypothetical protein